MSCRAAPPPALHTSLPPQQPPPPQPRHPNTSQPPPPDARRSILAAKELQEATLDASAPHRAPHRHHPDDSHLASVVAELRLELAAARSQLGDAHAAAQLALAQRDEQVSSP